MTRAFLHAIAVARPDHDIHAPFVSWAQGRIDDPREARAFERMATRSGIDHRWSILPPTAGGGSPVDLGGFYAVDRLPSTAARMAIYADAAPVLALAAVAKLGAAFDPGAITHLVVASCTGFVAPGIDQILQRRLGLSPTVERVLIGFMGCYAGVTALRAARHIVAAEAGARVLVVAVELSTLHLEDTREIEPLLAMLQFSDGAAAAIVGGDEGPMALGGSASLTLDESDELIRWDIGDQGFVMRLSGEVPGRIEHALQDDAVRATLGTDRAAWFAVHAGGRSILDAVERGAGLAAGALDISRAVLRDYGNMSSATVMFVLERALASGLRGEGLVLAFGPGLAAEALHVRT